MIGACSFILEDVKCRAQFLVVRALSSLINTSVHIVIGAIPTCTTLDRMKPFTEDAILTQLSLLV